MDQLIAFAGLFGVIAGTIHLVVEFVMERRKPLAQREAEALKAEWRGW